ncbi:MAG TPA: AAA family ATPase, partial [Myxococcota bacterium]|nr:AAA family ATPase [Myxococcota bacterium]
MSLRRAPFKMGVAAMKMRLDDLTYTLESSLVQGPRHALYRARCGAAQDACLLKILKPRVYQMQDLEQLKHEWRIGARLRGLPGVLQPRTLHLGSDTPALAYEPFEGVPLEQLEAPLTLDAGLPLACALAAALGQVHACKVVHKDLKPQAILAAGATVKITHFGIAAHLPQDLPVLGTRGVIEGTLAYMAPEQTGRMNRGVDYRSDLYAVGMLLFELLAGRPAFEAQGPLEWIHAQIAREPLRLDAVNPSVPAPLAAVIAKLQAKMADDRYQTVRGLEADLERCRDAWQRTGVMPDLDLGAEDVPRRFLIPERLYGREAHVDALVRAFDRQMQDPRHGAVVVAGTSGMGKTSLIHALYRPIVRHRGKFISGKFDQYQRHIPYAGLSAALNDLVVQSLSEPEAALQALRARLDVALAGNAAVLVEL